METLASNWLAVGVCCCRNSASPIPPDPTDRTTNDFLLHFDTIIMDFLLEKKAQASDSGVQRNNRRRLVAAAVQLSQLSSLLVCSVRCTTVGRSCPWLYVEVEFSCCDDTPLSPLSPSPILLSLLYLIHEKLIICSKIIIL